MVDHQIKPVVQVEVGKSNPSTPLASLGGHLSV
jgi:hypothetical protein